MSKLYDSTDELVSLTTAAKILGCSRSKLYHDAQENQGLPYYKIHRRLRYRVSELLDYIDQQRVVPDPEYIEGTIPTTQVAANGQG